MARSATARWRGKTPVSDRPPAGSGTGSPVARALGVLELVGGSERPVWLADVIEAIALPKPTAHRILAMLERQRMLRREPDGRRYVAGPRLSARAHLPALRRAAAALAATGADD